MDSQCEPRDIMPCHNTTQTVSVLCLNRSSWVNVSLVYIVLKVILCQQFHCPLCLMTKHYLKLVMGDNDSSHLLNNDGPVYEVVLIGSAQIAH